MSKYFSISTIIAVLSGILVVLVVCLIITGDLLFPKCWWDCAPKRSFSELDLNLPKDLFPKGATIYPLHYLRDDTARDPAVGSISWDGGRLTYDVLRSASNSRASVKYNFDVKRNFFKNSG